MYRNYSICNEYPLPPVIEGDCCGAPDVLMENETAEGRLLCKFIETYPEMEPIQNDLNYIKRFYSIAEKIKCIDKSFFCISDTHLHGCSLLYKYLTFIAHYCIMSGLVNQENIPGLQSPFTNAQRISSVSLGDASINFDNSMFNLANSGSAFKGFMNATTYGREYLAMNQENTGFLYIN